MQLKYIRQFTRQLKTEISKIKKGNIVKHNDKLYLVVLAQARSQGRGGAIHKLDLKDLNSNSKITERFNANANLETVELEQKRLNYLYTDEQIILVDEDYKEYNVPLDLIDSKVLPFLNSEMEFKVDFHESKLVGVKIPDKTVAKVVSSGVVKNSTGESSKAQKMAELENGVKISVPEFVKDGDEIVIDLNEIAYLSRK
ncbi:hypothetical protein HDV01_001066 [Terramyces sp. JEL0728]|nr:hypothetical protein HDV01_001066 [Terramyces sp. JEL0728]